MIRALAYLINTIAGIKSHERPLPLNQRGLNGRKQQKEKFDFNGICEKSTAASS